MGTTNQYMDPVVSILEIILKRKYYVLLGLFTVILVISFGVTKMPDEYRAQTKLLISAPTLPVRSDVPYMSEYRSRAFLENQNAVLQSRIIFEKMMSKIRISGTEIELSLKDKIKKKIYAYLNIKEEELSSYEKTMYGLQNSIKATNLRRTNVFIVEARSQSPEMAARLANLFSETYIEYSNGLLYEKSKKAYGFLEEQSKLAQNDLIVSEKNLNDFKEKNIIVSLESESNATIARLTALEEKNQAIKNEIEKIEKNLNNKTFKEEDIRNINEDTELEQNLKNLKSDLAQKLDYLTEKHPDIILLKSKIDKLEEIKKTKYNANTKTISENNFDEERTYLKKLNVAKDNLSEEIKRLNDTLLLLTKKKIEFDKLNRNYLQKRDELERINAKLENAKILDNYDMRGEDVKIIDYAHTPTYPYKKKKNIILIVGTIAGLIFSCGIGIAVEFLDTTIKKPEEIESIFDIEVLGTLPKISYREIRRHQKL